MNKKLKNKIAALFAVLSFCSPQSSRAANVESNKIMKYLAIVVPSLVVSAGLICGGIALAKYLKNKNNDQENKKPIKGNPDVNKNNNNPNCDLKGQELENAKKLIDNFLKQEWIVNKKSKNFCNEELHEDNYKNFCAGKFQNLQKDTLDNLDNQGMFHLVEFTQHYNENKDSDSMTISKFASMSGDDYKILKIIDFGFEMRIEFDVKNDKGLSLEFWRRVQGDNVCHWYFLSKDIANN